MKRYIIGVDEAGRGPLAGPVTVAAVLVPRHFYVKNLKDSKKLTEEKRKEWFDYIKNNPKIDFVVSSVSSAVIDRINVYEAANLAASRAVKNLIKKNKLNAEIVSVLVDGSIKLKIKNFNYRVVIKGDEKIKAIRLASIVAKVTRDKAMKRYHRLYKNYDFNIHKGYGTKKHKEKIKKYGPCPCHRLTFIKA